MCPETILGGQPEMPNCSSFSFLSSSSLDRKQSKNKCSLHLKKHMHQSKSRFENNQHKQYITHYDKSLHTEKLKHYVQMHHHCCSVGKTCVQAVILLALHGIHFCSWLTLTSVGLAPVFSLLFHIYWKILQQLGCEQNCMYLVINSTVSLFCYFFILFHLPCQAHHYNFIALVSCPGLFIYLSPLINHPFTLIIFSSSLHV